LRRVLAPSASPLLARRIAAARWTGRDSLRINARQASGASGWTVCLGGTSGQSHHAAANRNASMASDAPPTHAHSRPRRVLPPATGEIPPFSGDVPPFSGEILVLSGDFSSITTPLFRRSRACATLECHRTTLRLALPRIQRRFSRREMHPDFGRYLQWKQRRFPRAAPAGPHSGGAGLRRAGQKKRSRGPSGFMGGLLVRVCMIRYYARTLTQT